MWVSPFLPLSQQSREVRTFEWASLHFASAHTVMLFFSVGLIYCDYVNALFLTEMYKMLMSIVLWVIIYKFPYLLNWKTKVEQVLSSVKGCPLGYLCLKQGGFQLVCSNVGTCIELCSDDWDCDLGERCVSNGCGHVCAAAWGQVKTPGASLLPHTSSELGGLALMGLSRSGWDRNLSLCGLSCFTPFPRKRSICHRMVASKPLR